MNCKLPRPCHRTDWISFDGCWLATILLTLVAAFLVEKEWTIIPLHLSQKPFDSWPRASPALGCRSLGKFSGANHLSSPEGPKNNDWNVRSWLKNNFGLWKTQSMVRAENSLGHLQAKRPTAATAWPTSPWSWSSLWLLSLSPKRSSSRIAKEFWPFLTNSEWFYFTQDPPLVPADARTVHSPPTYHSLTSHEGGDQVKFKLAYREIQGLGPASKPNQFILKIPQMAETYITDSLENKEIALAFLHEFRKKVSRKGEEQTVTLLQSKAYTEEVRTMHCGGTLWLKETNFLLYPSLINFCSLIYNSFGSLLQ